MPCSELLDVPAPAKLNLFLHVTGRLPDGYHLLQSVFMLIDWCDTLSFALRQGPDISRDDTGRNDLDLPGEDLTVRAARALQTATGCDRGVHITLNKQLPAQAGLGGGSSDAATCLLALNRLWELNLPQEELMRIGLTLGADVPFFLGGRHAWVEGIGERLTPIDLPPARFLVLKPPIGVSTPQIFRHPALKRNTNRSIIEDFVANDGRGLFEFGRNDLQGAAQALCPDIEAGLQWLSSSGLTGRMTGSGSAMFARIEHDVDLSTLPAGWSARHCNNLDAHPLLGWC